MTVLFGTRYAPRNGKSDDVGSTSISDASLTRQEFAAECDINLIMARYLKTGVFPPGLPIGRYADFSDVGDYREALEILDVAREQFAGLPAKIRDEFGNDPAKFLEAVRNPENRERFAELGMLSEEATAAIKAKNVAKPPPKEEKA